MYRRPVSMVQPIPFYKAAIDFTPQTFLILWSFCGRVQKPQRLLCKKVSLHTLNTGILTQNGIAIPYRMASVPSWQNDRTRSDHTQNLGYLAYTYDNPAPSLCGWECSGQLPLWVKYVPCPRDMYCYQAIWCSRALCHDPPLILLNKVAVSLL